MGELVNGMVAVNMALETRKTIKARWTHALTAKVFGRTVGFHFLHSGVISVWKPAGRLDCVDLGRDYFLIRFGLVEGYEIVRLPKFLIEYYDPRVLKEVGSAIGPVLWADSNTASEVRGRFARICIQVDLNKPLTMSILLEGVVQEVQYEGINNLCFSCGRVGHRREGCPYTIKESKHDLEMDGKTNLSSGKEGNSEMEGDNSQEAGKTEDDLKDDGKDEYGPWLLVKRKKIGLRVGGPRNSNQGVGASLGKGAILSLEALTKQMKVSNDRPNHRVTSGLEEGYKKALHLLLR
nr:uncharacterized protein LOC112030090 [Quercus suber]